MGFCQILKYRVDHNLARIGKGDKYLAREHDYKDINFLIKIREIYKIKKILSALLFFLIKKQNKHPICMSRNTFKRHVDLLLIVEEGKGHYIAFKDF